MKRNRAVTFGIVASIAGALGSLPGALAVEAATESDARGVTRTAVSIAGIVTGDATTAGAEIGVQARVFRENSRGGVAGRVINYVGTEADHSSLAENTAAVTKLSASAFAIVPMSTSTIDVGSLERQRIPFFGSAATTAWESSAVAFGFTGALAVEKPRTASPAWGQLLRELLGDSRGKTVSPVVDSSALGTARADQARASLRSAGFTVLDPVVVPAPATPSAAAPDLSSYANAIFAAKPDVALLLTAAPYASALASNLGALGFTGTVGSDTLYEPLNPAIANGVTVLTTFAPLEQDTAANRRMLADVRLIKADQAITPAVAAGYWSADLFIAILKKSGRQLTPQRFLSIANSDDFRHVVPGTIGATSWPAMHAQAVSCGALVQSDGTQYVLAVPYRCGKTIKLSG